MPNQFELTVHKENLSEAERQSLPFAQRIPLHCVEYREEARTVVFEVEMDKELANFRNVAHGGMLATIFDNCMGETVRGILHPAWGATVDLSTHFLRPVPIGSTLVVTVRLLTTGKTLATMDLVACVKGEEDKPTNLATGTFYMKF